MTNAQPGWYPVDDHERWWDGQQWSEHTRAVPQTALAQVDDRLRAGVAKMKSATSRPERQAQPGELWATQGKPLSGIGAGRYVLTERYLFFERGALRTNAQQIPVDEIFDVDATQTMTQKARGVGTITLRVQRPSGIESVRLEDIADFRDGVTALNRASTERREELQRQKNAQTLRHDVGASPMMGPTSEPSGAVLRASSTDEVLSQLERLAKLLEVGALTQAEFDAKKTDLLGRL